MSIWDFWLNRPKISDKDQQLHEREPSRNKPRVIITLDRSWINLIGLTWFTYFRLIRRAGGVPQRVDYGRGPEPETIISIAEAIMQQGDALLLSGGVDVDPKLYSDEEPTAHINPRRDRFEKALIEFALRDNKPVMGICRGCQLLNVTTGGTLQSIRTQPEKRKNHHRFKTHPIHVEPDSRVADFIEGDHLAFVRSLHGQAVKTTGPGMRICAHAPDGVPEAIECDPCEERWTVGVQWHPELMPFKNQEHKIVDHFVRAARERMD